MSDANIFRNIFICVQYNKEIYVDLEQLLGEQFIIEFSFLGVQNIFVFIKTHLDFH